MIGICSRVVPGISDDPLLASIKHNTLNTFGESSFTSPFVEYSRRVCTSFTAACMECCANRPTVSINRHGDYMLENNNTC